MDLRWRSRPDGSVTTAISGTIGYRHVQKTEYPVWSEGGEELPVPCKG